MSSLPAPSGVPRVSVVMPSYNTERYIVAAVRSALDPAFPDVEVLVVDDGSTDQSVAAVRAIGDPRVTVIPITASGGPSRPRNIGMQHARAPYVSLMDSDDLLKPGKLASSVAALERFPRAGFAFGNYEKMDADDNVFETSFSYAYPVFRSLPTQPAGEDWQLIPQREAARGLVYENFVGTSGVVLRRDLAISLGGFDETLPNGDDLDMWFRLAHAADALYSPRIGHAYRIRAASVVRGPPLRNAASRIKVLRRERARWGKGPERSELDRRIAENLAGVGYQLRLRHERWQAMRSYLQAYSSSPTRRYLAHVIAAALFAPHGAGAKHG
jgi:cellulose synthase/poly-beta-1,6-N-acetylglucosamine synthase-like glycosyltransferase